MSMILENDERIRFATYCQVQADSLARITEQIDKMGGGPAMEVLKKRQRQKAAAYSIVAMDLMLCETESAGGG